MWMVPARVGNTVPWKGKKILVPPMWTGKVICFFLSLSFHSCSVGILTSSLDDYTGLCREARRENVNGLCKDKKVDRNKEWRRYRIHVNLLTCHRIIMTDIIIYHHTRAVYTWRALVNRMLTDRGFATMYFLWNERLHECKAAQLYPDSVFKSVYK